MERFRVHATIGVSSKCAARVHRILEVFGLELLAASMEQLAKLNADTFPGKSTFKMCF